MTDASRMSLMEHLAFACPLPLRDCCERIRRVLQLPELHYDFENETEWGLVEIENLEYNISRPYEEGTLQKWSDSVPVGCNFGISLIVYREHLHAGNHDWAFDSLVVPVGEALASEFQTSIFYDRTWFGPGKNTTRDMEFEYSTGRTSRG
jgi:hypothetical protein